MGGLSAVNKQGHASNDPRSPRCGLLIGAAPGLWQISVSPSWLIPFVAIVFLIVIHSRRHFFCNTELAGSGPVIRALGYLLFRAGRKTFCSTAAAPIIPTLVVAESAYGLVSHSKVESACDAILPQFPHFQMARGPVSQTDSGDGTTQKIRRAPVPCAQPGNDCTVSCHRAVEECTCRGKQGE
jgi:hypothetical protein